MPDDMISAKFDDFISKCGDCLSRKNFVKSVDDWPKTTSHVMNMLSGKHGRKIWTSRRFPTAVEAGTVTIRTILMAATMSRMFRNIIQDHFFWLGASKNEKVKGDARATLQWVEDLGRKGK